MFYSVLAGSPEVVSVGRAGASGAVSDAGSVCSMGCRRIHDDGFAGFIPGHIRQYQRRQHEQDGCGRGSFAQKSRRTRAPEERLAGTATECGAHVGALAGLQKYDHNQGNAHNNVYNDNE